VVKYINDENKNWSAIIKKNIKETFDGFEIYNGIRPVECKLIIREMVELDKRNDAVVVPECSYYYPEGIIRSEYVNIAYKVDDKTVTMWTAKETWYAPYLLEVLFQQQGITFIHGASVAVDNTDGKLLVAFGGIGKTCFIANAAKKEGVNILGDDLILVSEDGMLYSYPRPFCLYEYHIPLFPQYFSRNKVRYVNIGEKQYVKKIIRRLKYELHINDKNVYHYITVSPVHLFEIGKIQIEPVPIKDIYILRRNQKCREVASMSIKEPQKAVNFAMNVIMHEWDIGLKVILNRHAQNFKSFEEYLQPRQEILTKAFSRAKSISCVDIPEKMNATDVSVELNRLILEEKV
jgi:hypothetical protein